MSLEISEEFLSDSWEYWSHLRALSSASLLCFRFHRWFIVKNYFRGPCMDKKIKFGNSAAGRAGVVISLTFSLCSFPILAEGPAFRPNL
jgi:hypothetical protein